MITTTELRKISDETIKGIAAGKGLSFEEVAEILEEYSFVMLQCTEIIISEN